MIERNDIHLEYNCDKGFYDLELTDDGTDLLSAVNLRTSIGISLFTDQRSNDDDSVPNQRGWPGDALNLVDEGLLGSKLWLLQLRKTLDENIPRVEQFAADSLQWLLDDNIAQSVSVVAVYTSKQQGIMKITVTIVEFTGEDRKFEYVWEQKLV